MFKAFKLLFLPHNMTLHLFFFFSCNWHLWFMSVSEIHIVLCSFLPICNFKTVLLPQGKIHSKCASKQGNTVNISSHNLTYIWVVLCFPQKLFFQKIMIYGFWFLCLFINSVPALNKSGDIYDTKVEKIMPRLACYILQQNNILQETISLMTELTQYKDKNTI